MCITYHSYLSLALSKILLHSKTIKNAKKLSVFGESDFHCLSDFLQTHIFWKFDHIGRTYNQINYSNMWFPKETRTPIMMVQVLFYDIFFSKKTRSLMLLSRREFMKSVSIGILISIFWLKTKWPAVKKRYLMINYTTFMDFWGPIYSYSR